MKSAIYASQEIKIGHGATLECPSPIGTYAVVFEDDGDTGYFYAVDMRLEDPIVDALHIYNVEQVSDQHFDSEVQIVWSGDGKKSLLMINNNPHAVFDFLDKRGYCLNNYPVADKRWTDYSHEWDDGALGLFGEG